MGLAHKTLPVWGVQFHPESIISQSGHELLQNFIDLGKAYGVQI
jgi:anthranilate/para-aminobenzoate synthase component II